MKKYSVESDLLQAVEKFLGNSLQETEQIFAKELSGEEACVDDIVRHTGMFRGKRLRPCLLLLAAKATGDIQPGHHVLAAVVEMIHVATLVHDDVLDDANTRRHVATVNSRWNTETSVLFGDYLFTHSFHLAASVGSADACRQIGRATNLVCEGELVQIHERGNWELTEDRYISIISRKTAELIAVSCLLGAQLGRECPEQAAALENYGRSIGIAFQIADDLLDLIGDEEQVGKTLGSDLATGKLTLPLIHLLEREAAAGESETRRLLTANQSENLAEQLRGKLEAAGSLLYARERAVHYTREAIGSLSILPESPAKQLLADIAEFVVQRGF
ncbi:polyprenyl synthetase family protein [Calycomorphotria hydatis]|uniref:Octaprenyl-diphosphate synthase n=1 Tax=Calycomorphotria hydatis TaxID=2528027 RepID=A0A517TCE3_9PLAN|nr:polyprenyl synthetase family protein [Calycomorphotria hydatis]QDT66052.1 Octaprenyl-diphosphate synthase [Calycomorphotria hydatis]